MIKQAVIFCGGYGTRLFPITKKIPKPMVNINKKPFLFYLLQQCKANGINEVVLLCGYKFEVIKKFFGDGEKINQVLHKKALPKLNLGGLVCGLKLAVY